MIAAVLGATSGRAGGFRDVPEVRRFLPATLPGLSPYLRSTDGYQALSAVCARSVLAAIPFVGSRMRVEAEAPSGTATPQPG